MNTLHEPDQAHTCSGGGNIDHGTSCKFNLYHHDCAVAKCDMTEWRATKTLRVDSRASPLASAMTENFVDRTITVTHLGLTFDSMSGRVLAVNQDNDAVKVVSCQGAAECVGILNAFYSVLIPLSAPQHTTVRRNYSFRTVHYTISSFIVRYRVGKKVWDPLRSLLHVCDSNFLLAR